MRVIHLLDSLGRGGTEILTLDVCRNAASAGLDLTFVATGGGDLDAAFAASGVKYFRLQRRLPVDPRVVRALREIIKERRVEIVHTHQAVEAIHAWLATRGTGVRCVMSLHNRLLDRKNRIATKFILPRMDAVVPVSRALQEWYRNEEGFEITARFHPVVNGIDIKRLAPVRSEGSVTLREELGIRENDVLIGTIGNFYVDERKDQLTICRALPKVFGRFPNAHFVFVGTVHEGAEAYQLLCREHCSDNGIGDRVNFVGRRSDIPDILRELDLFVFSSTQEGLPLAAVEALLLGVPAIVSDIPPLLEAIGEGTAEGRCAEVFHVGDYDDLAEKMGAMLGDRSRLSEIAAKARTQTRKNFGIEAYLTNFRFLYRDLIADN